MRTFSQNLHVLFWAFQVGLNSGNPSAGTLARVSAPVERHIEHVATGSVPGAGPSTQQTAERLSARTAKASRIRIRSGHVTNKAGLFEVASAPLTLEEEQQTPLAALKFKMEMRGLQVLPAEAISDDVLCAIANMANDGYLSERSQQACPTGADRIALEVLEARLLAWQAKGARLPAKEWKRLKDLRKLRAKGLI